MYAKIFKSGFNGDNVGDRKTIDRIQDCAAIEAVTTYTPSGISEYTLIVEKEDGRYKIKDVWEWRSRDLHDRQSIVVTGLSESGSVLISYELRKNELRKGGLHRKIPMEEMEIKKETKEAKK